MHDEINQNISRLLDDDLSSEDALKLLSEIQTNDALKMKMQRYQAIGTVLKNDEYFAIRPDFSSKISQCIELEPSYLLPQRKQQKSAVKLYYAAAASALLATALVGQVFYHHFYPAENNQVVVAASMGTQQMLPLSTPQTEKSAPRDRRPMTAQFNDYLQAHNSSVYTNGEANFHPYAKVAAYGKE